MATRASHALPYESGTVYHPSVSGAPWRFALIFAGLWCYILLGTLMMLFPIHPGMIVMGSLTIGIGGLALASMSLLYLPAATWLRIGESGMTYSMMFWRRSITWAGVRELRIVSLTGDAIIEVVPTVTPPRRWFEWRFRHQYVERGSWAVMPTIFGWTAEALVQEMDDWRARNLAS